MAPSTPDSEIRILKRSRTEALQTQRKFFKKTARGKVIKVLRERYLRPSIPCGIVSCTICAHSDPSTTPTLQPSRKHSAFPTGHYVVPDTNILLHQIDLVESEMLRVPMVLLQTVLDEVRHRSLPIFARVGKVIEQGEEGEKRVWVFHNEFCSDTAVFRKEDESPNDRNDRSIRTATQWYNTHVAQSFQSQLQPAPSTKKKKAPAPAPPVVVLLTDDTANRKIAQEEGIPVMSAREYVKGLPDSEKLLDVLNVRGEETGEGVVEGTRAKRDVLYPEYISVAACQAGVKSGQLYQGHFNASQYNYLEGSVNVQAFSKPVLLVGREHMNRAIDGDIVAVHVFPETEWRAPGDEVVDQDAALKNDDPDNSENEDGDGVDDQEAKLSKREEKATKKTPKVEKQPTGKVVGVIKRNWRAYVCHIDRTSLSSHLATTNTLQTVFATPLSRSIPRIRLRTRQAPSLLDQKILVTIDDWTPTSRYPEGHFVRALGKVESKEAERESLLLEFGVPYRPFGRKVRECLPPEGDSWVVVPKGDGQEGMWKGREDLRELGVCSIDPPGCQDIDDALHARPLPNGNIEAGVHIADVSHFVLPDTPMDNEAASRGTTVYLVDQRIDMLPELLGTNLCSLRPFVERLAFSCVWELTPDAEIVNVRFTKSIIASKEAFTYEQAQKRKDDRSLTDPLTNSIRLLNSLAIKLKQKRMAAGALNLASPEIKIHLASAESSDPVDVEQKELFETNSLVEEFMLLANISVARRVWEAWPATAVLRRHQPPPRTNFEKLQDVLMKRKGIALDVSSSGALADSLDQCIDADEPAFNTLVRIMATRCMLAAEYFSSGSVSRESFGHYGLASPIYTHFTSPIRRYADVLVHRQLAAAIGFTTLHASLHSRQHVEQVLDNVNRRHRMAQMAGRASTEFYTGLALRAKGEKEGKVREKAFVIRVFRNGVAVYAHSLGLEGLVMFEGEETTLDAENYTLEVRGRKLNVFDKVDVEIGVEKDANTLRAKVKMSLV
ncbi:exosome catalytic subunit dis3 [Tulasnella sp. 403]|nr:exosome catalytic subunit dis3 [Tulasnella sp. 403]